MTNVKTAGVLNPEDSHLIVNDKNNEEIVIKESVTEFNEEVDKYVEKFKEHEKNLDSYAKGLKESMDTIEIKVIADNILIKPFKENPFQKIEISEDSGLILDLGGAAPEYKSNQSGEMEEEKNFIEVGTVVDAGPLCKYLKEDDVVMYTIHSKLPVPFFKQGLVLVNENRIMAVVNEGLTERFKSVK